MFIINSQTNEPIFEQIINQVVKFKELGILKAGDKLPSVRALAGDLGINPNTVSKAYQELELMGIVESLNKKGVFINENKTELLKNKLLDNLAVILNDCLENKIAIKEVQEVVFRIYGGESND